MTRILISCWLLVLTGNFLQAQQARQFSFTHYNSKNGLASNNVYNACQDNKGYIWIATVNGLQRFDGKDFLTFRHSRKDNRSIPANNVAAVFADRKGRIWIINEDNSVGIFDTDKFDYHPVDVDLGVKKANMFFPSKILEDWNGKIFLLIVAHGVYELNESQLVFKPVENILIPKGWNTLEIVPDPEKNCYWIGADSGLAKYDPATRQLSYRQHNMARDPIIDAFSNERNVGGIMPVKNSRSFSCNTWPPESGHPVLYWFDGRTGKTTRHIIEDYIPKTYNEIKGQFQQSNGQVWVYGLPFIASLDTIKQQLSILSQPAAQNVQMQFDHANNIFEDRQKNLWVSTSDGLFVFNPESQAFNAYYLLRPGMTKPIDAPVNSILQLSNRQIWVGTWGRGLYCYDENFHPLPVPAPLDEVKDKMTIWYLHQHSRTGLIFIGEQGGFLKVYDPSTGKYLNGRLPVFDNRTIRQITEDGEGNLWFGTQGGRLVKWKYSSVGKDFTSGYEIVAQPGLVHRLYTDTDGSVWVATLGNGLYHIDHKTGNLIEQITSSGKKGWKLSNDSPTDLIRYNDSLLIIAANSITVLNTRNKSSRTVSLDDGLPSNTAYFVRKDLQGRLWLGLQNGLCRWNFEQNSFTLFDRRDGILYDNLTTGGAFSLSKGRLAFASNHNFLVFDPAQLVQSANPPDITITGIHVMDKPLPVDSVVKLGSLELTAQNNSIVIDYSSLQYLNHNQLTIYHMLDGLDKDWVKSVSGKAIYNYLPYRNYTFRMKSVNGDGRETESTTSLGIRVRPPFWQSYWFLAMMVFLGVGFLYWLDRLRMQKIRATESIRRRIAGSLTEDLTNSLSSINISSELAKTKLESDTMRTRDYIHQISETSNRMTQAMYDMVWSINPQNDQLNKTLERMKQYITEQESIHDIDISIDADPSIAEKESDMEHRYELLCIFKEAISNSVKHSEAKIINVQLRLRKNKLLLLIQDDGKGFDTGTVALGRGINDMKRRAEAIGAQIEILSEKNTGTLIRLEMGLR